MAPLPVILPWLPWLPRLGRPRAPFRALLWLPLPLPLLLPLLPWRAPPPEPRAEGKVGGGGGVTAGSGRNWSADPAPAPVLPLLPALWGVAPSSRPRGVAPPFTVTVPLALSLYAGDPCLEEDPPLWVGPCTGVPTALPSPVPGLVGGSEPESVPWPEPRPALEPDPGMPPAPRFASLEPSPLSPPSCSGCSCCWWW